MTHIRTEKEGKRGCEGKGSWHPTKFNYYMNTFEWSKAAFCPLHGVSDCDSCERSSKNLEDRCKKRSSSWIWEVQNWVPLSKTVWHKSWQSIFVLVCLWSARPALKSWKMDMHLLRLAKYYEPAFSTTRFSVTIVNLFLNFRPPSPSPSSSTLTLVAEYLAHFASERIVVGSVLTDANGFLGWKGYRSAFVEWQLKP